MTKHICARVLCLLSLSLAGPGLLSAQAVGDAGTFVVRPGDILTVTVWPNSEFSGEFPVENTGFVYLPALGPVEVGGKQLSEVRSQIRELYREGIRAPIITVNPRFRVSVGGGVRRPGLYFVDPTYSIFDAISEAGGFTDNAREDRVELVRGGQLFGVNAEAPTGMADDAFSLGLQSGDRIQVPTKATIDVREVLWILQSVAVLAALLSRVNG